MLPRGLLPIALLCASIASCKTVKPLGDQCVFNSDCESPLICAGRRCRAPCTGRPGDRECLAGAVCLPSENPQTFVCVPNTEPSLCGRDPQCPAGAVCLQSACFWTCRDSDLCAANRAGTCTNPPGLCETPVTAAQLFSLMPSFTFLHAADGGAPADAVVAGDVAGDVAPALTCAMSADCALPNASARCDNQRCAVASCTSGFGDCNGAAGDGCEVRTSTDALHCGACNTRCAAAAHTTMGCASGRCVVSACEAGFADCDGDPDNGCEVDLANDPRHCGACRASCATANVAEAVCAESRCRILRCAAGWGDCDRTGTPSAVASPTAEWANGCEIDTTTDAANCGACGTRCDTVTGLCTAGACGTGRALGWVDTPTSSVREMVYALAAGESPRVVTVVSGVYNLNRLFVGEGIELRVSGNGSLDLRVLGEARVEGKINVSGGPGGNSVVASDTTLRMGGGGHTGTVVGGAQSDAPVCAATGGGGGNTGTIGQWAPGASLCGGPGNLGGGSGGAVGFGGNGGGGVSGGGGGGSEGRAGGAGSGVSAFGGSSGATGANGQSSRITLNGAATSVGGYVGTSGTSGTCAAGGGAGGSASTDDVNDPLALRTFFTGSGGGGGGSATAPGAGGGGGGGALRISSATRIVVSGRLLADGGDGGSVRGTGTVVGGAGGGGSGGLIHLVAPSIITLPNASVTARGGIGGNTFNPAGAACERLAGNGGAGRVVLRTRCDRFMGSATFVPPLSPCVAASAVSASGTPASITAAYP
jgi:Dickkopf N-terminal cysteine-rich region